MKQIVITDLPFETMPKPTVLPQDRELLHKVKQNPHERRKIPIKVNHKTTIYIAPENNNPEFIDKLKLKYKYHG